MNRNDPCPCGSEQKFKKCCGPALSGTAWPESPEALMRSRYTAFVTGDVRHIYRTTHPENEDVRGVNPDKFITDTLSYCKRVDFTGLQVLQTWNPNEKGKAKVLFTARYQAGGQSGTFTELSEFVQSGTRWLYFGGQELDDPLQATIAPLVQPKKVSQLTEPGEPPTVDSR